MACIVTSVKFCAAAVALPAPEVDAMQHLLGEPLDVVDNCGGPIHEELLGVAPADDGHDGATTQLADGSQLTPAEHMNLLTGWIEEANADADAQVFDEVEAAAAANMLNGGAILLATTWFLQRMFLTSWNCGV